MTRADKMTSMRDGRLQQVIRRAPWKVVLVTAAFAFAVPLSLALITDYDFGEIVYFLLVAPTICLTLIIAALVKKSSKVLLALVIFVPVSWLSLKNSYALRIHTRWLLHAPSLKNSVLAQQTPKAGQLKHLEWDGWGFAGSETNVYLVFDPTDALAKVPKNSEAKAPGLPCAVSDVRKLESQWYSVTFYTDTGWNDCG